MAPPRLAVFWEAVHIGDLRDADGLPWSHWQRHMA